MVNKTIVRHLGFGIAVVAGILVTWSGTTKLVSAAADKSMQSPQINIEVDIRDTEQGFTFKGWSLPGVPTTIVLRNHDHMTHGFTSRLFNEVEVRKEGQGSEVGGKGFKSFHVEPGQTLTLHFVSPQSKHDPLTGGAATQYYAFWCDLHPEARGELYIVETKGEIGGG
jgi:hypothetical protein